MSTKKKPVQEDAGEETEERQERRPKRKRASAQPTTTEELLAALLEAVNYHNEAMDELVEVAGSIAESLEGIDDKFEELNDAAIYESGGTKFIGISFNQSAQVIGDDR